MRKPPPPAHRRRWMRALLLALPLLLLPVLYAALGAARSTASPTPPRQRLGSSHDARGLPPPRLAYLISGAGPGDGPRIRRLLRALYHPWNCYLVGVAGEEDRADLEAFVRGQEATRRYGNVRVAGAGEWAAVTRRGPTELAATLHAAALLLREFDGWSWFINLSASSSSRPPRHRAAGCLARGGREEDERTCPLCRAPLIPDEMSGALLWAAAAGVPDASDFDFSYFGAPLAPVPSPTLLRPHELLLRRGSSMCARSGDSGVPLPRCE